MRRPDLTNYERQRRDLMRTAEAFRRAMIESGAVNHVRQDLYIDQLRALETALNTDNYRARPIVLEQSETLDGRLAQTVRLPDGSEAVRLVGQSRKNSRTAAPAPVKYWKSGQKMPPG